MVHHWGWAFRAAATARSMSAGPACVRVASGFAVAGFSVSNVSRPGSLHLPPTKSPKLRPRPSSHSCTGPADSGAGPYSIDWKISGTDAMEPFKLRKFYHRGTKDTEGFL